jgi:hypothetical protein
MTRPIHPSFVIHCWEVGSKHLTATSLRLEKDLLDRVDQRAGSKRQRSAFIRRVLEEAVDFPADLERRLNEYVEAKGISPIVAVVAFVERGLADAGLRRGVAETHPSPTAVPASMPKAAGPPMSFETRVLLAMKHAAGATRVEKRANAEQAVRASMGESNG